MKKDKATPKAEETPVVAPEPHGKLASVLLYEGRLLLALAFTIIVEVVVRLTSPADGAVAPGLSHVHWTLRTLYILAFLVLPFSSRNIITVAQRELVSYFTSPLAYVVMVFFLFFSGLIFTFSILSQSAQADMGGLLGSMVFLTLMVAPFITMSLLAQERATGTLELLLTKPLHDREVVLGKYLGSVAIYGAMLLLTLEFPLLLDRYGDLDWGPVWVGYLGLLLVGAAFLGIGLFASALTRSQMASAGICLGAFLFFWLIGWVSMLGGQETWYSQVAKNISVFELVSDFEKGLIDSKNLVFFTSLSAFFLFLSVRIIEMRRQV